MNLQDVAYILRYVFLILIGLSAVSLTILAIREYRWGLKHALRPARGFFLLTVHGRHGVRIRDREERRGKSAGEGQDEYARLQDQLAREEALRSVQGEGQHYQQVLSGQNLDPNFESELFFQDFESESRQAYHQAGLRARNNEAALRIHRQNLREQEQAAKLSAQTLAIYPTTVIGRGRSCDIQIFAKKVQKRHATLYRYDGQWFIRPQSSRAQVLVNGEAIDGEVPLKNRDHLEFSGVEFDFIDEYQSASEAGLDYRGAELDDAYFLDAVRVSSRSPWLAFVLFNAFSLLGGLLLLYYLPDHFLGHYNVIAGMLLAYLVLVDLYYLILPKLLDYGDRILLLAASYVASVGVLIQARFSFFRNPYLMAQLETNDPNEIQDAVRILVNRFIVQMGAVILGLILLSVLAYVVKKTRFLESLTLFCFIVTPLFLIVTKILGRGMEENGANLWINIGPISLQLTEFAKISYAVVVASFFKNRPRLKTQFFFAGWAMAVFFLIMLLPDLGSAMILLPTTVIVFVVMTSEYVKGLLIVLASSFVAVMAYTIFPHVQARINGWTSLWVEVNARNAQIIYGLQGVARGGLLGRGYTNGHPWGIPLFNSDMVFAIVIEEFGLLVALAVVLCYTVVWLRSARGSALARDGFSSSLLLTLGSMIFIEAFVVIGGTTGLVPLTGATLPLIARGGSSILAKWIMFALIFGLLGRQEAGANRLMRRASKDLGRRHTQKRQGREVQPEDPFEADGWEAFE